METMVVVGVMTIIMVVVSQVFVVNGRLMATTIARVDDENGATVAIRKIGDLTRGASEIVASKDMNGTIYTTGASTLVLKIPSVDASGAIVTSSYDYVAFYRHATKTSEIWTDTYAATGSARKDGQKRLTAYNSILTFSYNDYAPTKANRVSVFLVNSQKVHGQTLTTKAWTSIFLRNN